MNFNHILLAALALISACQQKPEGGEEKQDPIPAVPTPAFAKGADVSWVSEMEKDGKQFRTTDGKTADIFDVLKEKGVNAVRLRVWVNPDGGWSGKDDVVKLGVRAARAGLALMVDFHYSDFFADPSRQKVPAAWEADKNDLAKMAAHVSDHTKEVLTALKDAGVTPAWIQVGNETRNGMLWPAGQLWTSSGELPGGRANFTRLYNAGYDAAKSVFPGAAVMPHLNNAYEDNAWWFRQMKAEGAKFDAIALSHYPQAESRFDWQQYNAMALAQVKALAAEFGVPVYVSEVGVKTTANEILAAQVISEFMKGVKALDKCKGVFYWEPEVYGRWKPAIYGDPQAIYRHTGKSETWNAYDMGAFLSDGSASSVMDAFK